MSATKKQNVKALAMALGVCTKTIYRAYWAGFEMPNGEASADDFLAWRDARRKARCPKMSKIGQ